MQDGPDDSSIKPVSSLRSRFENLGKDGPPLAVKPRQASTHIPKPTDGIRSSHGLSVDPSSGSPQPSPRLHLQPVISTAATPKVSPSVVDPPTHSLPSPIPPRPLKSAIELTKKTPLRTTNSVEPLAPETSNHAPSGVDPVKPLPFQQPVKATQSHPPAKIPPPVNRTAKPCLSVKPAGAAQNSLVPPEPNVADITDASVSPFSTPPSSSHTSPERIQPARRNHPSHHARNQSEVPFAERMRRHTGASTPESRLRAGSDASWVQRLRGDSDSSTASEAASVIEFTQSPTDVFAGQSTNESPSRKVQSVPSPVARFQAQQASRPMPQDRMPARPELQARTRNNSPPKATSGRISPSKLSQQIFPHGPKRAIIPNAPERPLRIPATNPVQRSGTAIDQSLRRSSSPSTGRAPPVVPAPRRSMDMRRPQTHLPTSNIQDEIDNAVLLEQPGSQLTDYPDSSQANRRPPRYKQRPWQIPTDYDPRLVALCGEYVATSGHITRAWRILTGEVVCSMPHSENLKVTALAFKPGVSVKDDGQRLWIGTNTGELHEIDIPTNSLVNSKLNAHKREVIKIFRRAAELWTLDDGGELNVWRPTQTGVPELDAQCVNFRTPRGHTFSMVVGKYLWIATGKDLRVFNPAAHTDTEFQVLRGGLSQPGVGDVTSGAMLSHQPDLVYFGHSDGKVSIYNYHDYSCLGVVAASVYKLSTLMGVGEYLWAGFYTGMIYIFDTSTTPWKALKDWDAHDKKQLHGIVADHSTLWNIDRLPVVSLGADSMLRIWDGLLEEDWLDARMHYHDAEYCTFREISASVMTWNAGASKPRDLEQDKQDNNFFREYIGAQGAPDIFVFAFQELVDLEDKKTTAKALFKSKKKMEGTAQERMSHQYRAWRDHLTKCLCQYLPAKHSYSLLHTASLVGLFTCIFIKASEHSRVEHIDTAQVKRGMGGYHGNKGALIVRMVLDDSSLCFINCHLAAGQTQTVHRNNDIAAILEAEALPSYPLNQNRHAKHADVFPSGGDGAIIQDHEICILNGDLNYRIDTMSRDTVVKHVHANNLARLLERDQLLLSRKRNPAFRLRAFQESPITFAPTYKYNVHSDEYDTSEKKRAPAWCDRILYRGKGKVMMEEYRRWEVRASDHRPVTGRLRIRLKTVDGNKRMHVREICEGEFVAMRARITEGLKRQYKVHVLGLS
ncbi:DNase I-like protein [Piedraia hortae CBS 480.64]|uniref:DNase I-like protein n=1 Tax=Piedraia hortae CBS 480.64 TaxID=1314780 RepID=A0A6A7BY80_9PEZI|nr:DNase I-like protein [Piedraia hortae CBS 480.64]